MHVAELWRYPVKSLAGERLEQAEIRPDGIVGDRLVQVYDARGHVVTARKHPDLLGHRGTLGPDGEPRIDGWPWASPEAAAAIAQAVGWKARLERFTGEERFDILPLLVATDGAIAALGVDGRRLRPEHRGRRGGRAGGARVAGAAPPDRRGGDRRRPAARPLRDDHL